MKWNPCRVMERSEMRPGSPVPSGLPDAIRHVRAVYHAQGISDHDIGNGRCETFAFDVLQHWIGDGWVFQEGHRFRTLETLNFVLQENDTPMDWDWGLLREFWNIVPPGYAAPEVLCRLAQECPNHVWITADGKHYDVESPDGVDSFFDLGFFRRWLEILRAEVEAMNTANEHHIMMPN